MTVIFIMHGFNLTSAANFIVSLKFYSDLNCKAILSVFMYILYIFFDCHSCKFHNL